MDQKKIIRLALFEEDKADNDITTALLPRATAIHLAEAVMVAKSCGVVCGVDVVREVFREITPRAQIKVIISDGKKVKPGDVILKLKAPLAAILSGERTALNFIQHLSGIATLTSRFVAEARRWGVDIYDTRKTTPSLRTLEKYAVRCGGGRNHRMDLSETVFVKDNHLVLSPNPRYWVEKARRKYGCGVNVEIECGSVAAVRRAALAGADVVLLDNMPFEKMKTAITAARKINPHIIIEISGGVNLKNVAAIARLKPERISVGALTHSAPSLDISLEIIRR